MNKTELENLREMLNSEVSDCSLGYALDVIITELKETIDAVRYIQNCMRD